MYVQSGQDVGMQTRYRLRGTGRPAVHRFQTSDIETAHEKSVCVSWSDRRLPALEKAHQRVRNRRHRNLLQSPHSPEMSSMIDAALEIPSFRAEATRVRPCSHEGTRLSSLKVR